MRSVALITDGSCLGNPGPGGWACNSRCDWLAQTAAATQRSCWEDGRRHAALRLDLGADYVPPKPQGGLFDDLDSGADDDEDGEEADLTGTG